MLGVQRDGAACLAIVDEGRCPILQTNTNRRKSRQRWRSFSKTHIAAQIHREADGFTRDKAAALDAELNIRDEQGSVADYVQHFRKTGITEAAANERGILGRSKPRSAFSIARDGSPSLIAAHRADVLSDQAAEEIAHAAPGNEALQSLGMKLVGEGRPISQATNTMHAVRLSAGDRAMRGAQGDAFGFDDSAIREAVEVAKRAAAAQREVREKIAAASGAAKNPEAARKLGVDVKDPVAVQAKLNELRAEAARLENWPTHPELVQRFGAKVAPERVEPASNPDELPRQQDDRTQAMFSRDPRDRSTGEMFGRNEAAPYQLETHTEADIRRREQAEREGKAAQGKNETDAAQRAKADSEAKDFRLSGSDRPADVAVAGGQRGFFSRRPSEVRDLGFTLPNGKRFASVTKDAAGEHYDYHDTEDAARNHDGESRSDAATHAVQRADAESAGGVRSEGRSDLKSAVDQRRREIHAEKLGSAADVEAAKRAGGLRQDFFRKKRCFNLSAAASRDGLGDMLIGRVDDGAGGRIWHAVVRLEDGSIYDPTIRASYASGLYEKSEEFAPVRSLTPEAVRAFLDAHDNVAPDAQNLGLTRDRSIDFSRTNEPRSGGVSASGGQTTEALRTELENRLGKGLVGALERAGILRLHADDSTLPGSARGSGARGVHLGRAAHLDASRIAPGKALGTLLHELGVHDSAEHADGHLIRILGDSAPKLLERFDRLAENGGRLDRELAAEARRRADAEIERRQREGRPVSEAMRQNETLAHFIELVENHKGGPILMAKKWLADAMAALRSWLLKSPALERLAPVWRKALADKMTGADFVRLAREQVERRGNEALAGERADAGLHEAVAGFASRDPAMKPSAAQLTEAARQVQAVRDQHAETLRAHREDGRPLPAPNGQPSKLNEHQWVAVRTPNFAKYFGDWKLAALEGQLRDTAGSELAERAATGFLNKPLTNPETGITATVSRTALNKMLSQSAVQNSISPQAHMMAVGNLDKLFPLAVRRLQRADSGDNSNIKAIHHLDVPMPFNGGVLRVKMLVKETTDPTHANPLYTVSAVEIEKPASSRGDADSSLAQTRLPTPPAGFEATFAQMAAAVKGDGVSKVVDENGEPRAVYHGTDSNFDVFDREKSGKGPSKLGFWLTDLPDFAENFGGTLVPAYVSIKKPKRMTTDQWNRVRAAHGGDPAYFSSMRDKLIAEGYDGLIIPGGVDQVGKFSVKTPAVYAAFHPNQIKSAIGNAGTFDPRFENITHSRNAPAPNFYSQMQRTLEQKLNASGTGEAMAKQIEALGANGGFKREEMEWSGITDWLRSKDNVVRKVSRAEVLDHLRANDVQLQEVTKGTAGKQVEQMERDEIERIASDPYDDFWYDELHKFAEQRGVDLGDLDRHDRLALLDEMSSEDDRKSIVDHQIGHEIRENLDNSIDLDHDAQPDTTKFAQYQLPGGDNYREMLLTLPAVGPRLSFEDWVQATQGRDVSSFKPQSLQVLRQTYKDNPYIHHTAEFRSGHYDEPNILAHVRMNDRTGPDGEKILHLEEIQSDRKVAMEQAESRGDQAESDRLRNLMPFADKYHELALKRMIRYAAENGYDKITWTTGEIQNARYDLSKHVNNVRAFRRDEGTYDLSAKTMDGRGPHDFGSKVPESKLEDHVGKDLAEKIAKQPGGWHAYEGQDLKAGGVGKRKLYDEIFPQFVNKYVKKWGGKVERTRIATDSNVKSLSRVHDNNAVAVAKRLAEDRGQPWADLGSRQRLQLTDEATQLPSSELDRLGIPKTNVTGGAEVHSLDITPAMRKSVVEDGQPLFSRATREQGMPKEASDPIASARDTNELKAHPDYKAAKAGDATAALRLVRDLVKPEQIAEAKQRFGNDAVYVPAIAEEASGNNAIPDALADYYAHKVGGSVTHDIVQANRAHHTGADPMERMIARPLFDGPVQRGAKYVVVDDVSTMGATLAEMADHIRAGGGDVAGSVLLANASRTGKLIPNKVTATLVAKRFGDAIRKLFHVDPSALTQDEAQYLSGFRDADALRARAAKAEGERTKRLLSKGIGEGQVTESGNTETPPSAGSSDSGPLFSRDQKREDLTSIKNAETDRERRARGYSEAERIARDAENLAADRRERWKARCNRRG